MTDFQPFEALRYDVSVAGDATALIAPPYDVVSPERAAELHARSPFSISRVDFGPSDPSDGVSSNRYTRARGALEEWQAAGALRRQAPAMYLYDQDFIVHGRRYRRRAVFGRLRLHEWDEGVVLPHEHTRAAAKADRFELLKTTRVNLSPIMAMYRNPGERPLADLHDAGPPVLSARVGSERHVLRELSPEVTDRISAALSGERLYVADGHHRYETALAYRDERRRSTPSWSGDEPENFVLAALIDVDDPGLVVLPTHRLVRMPSRSEGLPERLGKLFTLAEAGDASNPADIESLLARMAAGGHSGPVFGAIGLLPRRLHLVTIPDMEAALSLVPAEHAAAWRRLDVSVLHHALFPALGNLSRPEDMEFTEDAHEAARLVLAGEWDVSLLLNRTPVSAVLECADAGERMPQKSTYFYPKLATGIVMYPLG